MGYFTASSKKYKHISISERDDIGFYLAQGMSHSVIAKKIGRDKSSISREIKRNTSSIYNVRYRPHVAHSKSIQRKSKAHQIGRLKNNEVRQFVEKKLKIGWSPEIIAGRIKIEKDNLATNYESIYLYIYEERRDLIQYLVKHHKKRKKRGSLRKKRSIRIPNRVSINERPEEINNRKTIGHWESDSIVSRSSKAALNVITERVSLVTKISLLEEKSSEKTCKAMIKSLSGFPAKLKQSITYDNGTENVLHEKVNKSLGTKSYFCNPYSSYEKGTVENTNGLIRRFLPKKTDFGKVTKKEIKKIEDYLNNRPRVCLNFYTPNEFLAVALKH